MDSDSVVAIIALLCFFFFFFFFFLLGGVGVYFFIVKKKDTSEEETSDMTSQTRVPLVPFVPLVPLYPIVSPLLKKSESFDISEDKLFKDIKKRLESIEEKNEPFDISEDKLFKDIKKRIVILEDIVSGLQKEKELREKNASEKITAQEKKERIENEAKRLLDNLKEKGMISLSGQIEDAVLQELYRLDKSIQYRANSDYSDKSGKPEIYHLLHGDL